MDGHRLLYVALYLPSLAYSMNSRPVRNPVSKTKVIKEQYIHTHTHICTHIHTHT